MRFHPFSTATLPRMAALLSCGAVTLAAAQSPGTQPLWEVGAVGLAVNQQAYPGAEQQLNRALVLPFFIYRGQVLRADRESAGLRAIKTDQYELDIGVAGSFGSNSDEIDARRGMPALGTLVEFGPRLKVFLGPGPGNGRWRAEFPVRGVFDLSRSAAHRGTSFEPELIFERETASRWRYSTRLSAILADQRLASTFYGVDTAYATTDRPAYRAASGLVSTRLAVSLSYSPSRDWRLFSVARLNTVSGSANEASPLVRQSTGTSVGVGVVYTGFRSERMAVE